jgi:RNA polymerase sigma-70 factor (ECF subfamily)
MDVQDAVSIALCAEQRRLFAYILACVGNRTEADDVLQETNAVALRKRADFTPGTAFWPWLSTIAYFEVLSWRKRRQRERCAPLFDDNTCALLAAEGVQAFADCDQRLEALRRCLEGIAPKQRALIALRYQDQLSCEAIAGQSGRTPLAVRQALFRVRAALSQCIGLRLAAERPA